MSASKSYKRPSSSRRLIKQEQYSSFVSATRLRRLQNLLNDSNADDLPDCLLCIAGVDSRYNEGMSELLNYLLFDFYNVRRMELETSGYDDEIIDDAIFLIRKNSVDVYCNPINYMYFLPYIAHWKNLHIFCMTDEEYENQDKAEEFKIVSFISMMAPCTKVAIPFSNVNQEQLFDKMNIEKWPIIQAFALEGMGGGGFFTLKYEVVDFSNKLNMVYHLLEPVLLENLFNEQLPSFEKQWERLVQNISSIENNSDITGDFIVEPFKSYFAHGRLGSSKGSRKYVNEKQPFALVGTDTEKKYLDQAEKIGMVSEKNSLQKGLNGNPAFHFICQAISPKSALCCRRTYFLSSVVALHPLFEYNSVQKTKSDPDVLLKVYIACIDSLSCAIDVFRTTLNIAESKKCCLQTLLKRWEQLGIPVSSNHLSQKENVEFTLAAFDHLNCSVPASDSRFDLLAKYCSVTVYNIPSIEHRGQIVGSVSFGETFLNSALYIESVGMTENLDLDGKCAVVSSIVPRMITWQMSEKEKKLSKQILAFLKNTSGSEDLGAQMIGGEPVKLITEHEDVFLEENGLLYMYENALIYVNQLQGTAMFAKAEMNALHFYDGDSPSVVALLIITYMEHVQEYIPLQFRNHYNRFIISFEPRSNAYKKMFSEVLPKWKESGSKPEVQRIDEVPEEIKHKHELLQESYKLVSRPISKQTAFAKAKQRIQGLSEFISHFEASSVSYMSVPSKHATLIAGGEYDPGNFGESTNDLIVTLILGFPGSGKDNLCQVIKKMSQNDSRLAFIKPPLDQLHKYDEAEILRLLQATYSNYKHGKGEPNPKGNIKVIVVIPEFIDVRQVIQAIINHPEPEIAKRLKIGAVTLCIDPHNAFMCDRYPLPKLLDNCAQGWVNNIIFTSVKGSDDPTLSLLQETIRAVNSNVSLLVVEKADLTRSNDIDSVLSETAFNSDNMLRARYLSSPGWWKGKFITEPTYPELCEEMLRFSQPLEKQRLVTRMKSLKPSLAKFPFHGNVYFVRGKISLTEAPEQIYELEYLTLTDDLRITPLGKLKQDSKQQPFTIIFTGIQLVTRKLQDFLRGCAKQQPEQKLIRTRKNLTRREINLIHETHHLEPLPEGWFYNGAQYVSLSGEKSSRHPNLELYLEKYLEKINMEVTMYNEQIRQEHVQDLFD